MTWPSEEQLEALDVARYKMIRAEALLEEAKTLLREWGYTTSAGDVTAALRHIRETLDFP